MNRKIRSFNRPLGERRYRKFFIIATEGSVTEPQYFELFNNEHQLVKVSCLKNKNKNAPAQVLTNMKKYLKEAGLKSTDEAWLVVDKDDWSENQLKELHSWAKTNKNYGFALSNPKFEYWLLLHFEDGEGVTNSQICSNRLNRYIPDFHKKIIASKFTKFTIEDAIRRAKNKDTPPCDDWPKTTGTTIYKLIQNILNGMK